jgi:hypothetical protein
MSDEKMNNEQPGGPSILGELTPEEMQRLQGLKQQSEQAVHRVGLATINMLRNYQNVEALEKQAQGVLNMAGARLGIPQGTAWSVHGDGKVVHVGMPAPEPAPAPPQEVVTDEDGEAASGD